MKSTQRSHNRVAPGIPPIGAWVALVFLSAPGLATGGSGSGPGALDRSFGDMGVARTDFFASSDLATDIVIQSDGKIVAVGTAGDDFALARYNPDGSLDTTFGVAGKVVTDFFGDLDVAGGVALQADGKLVVAGSARGSYTEPDFALARYNPDGSLDNAFGSAGKVTTDFLGQFDQANDLAIDSNGKILVVGAARGTGTAEVDFALARYKSDGSLDTGFGVDGRVTTSFTSGDDHAIAVGIQGSKYVVAGYADGGSSGTDFAVARYDRGGNLDPAFGNGGKVVTDFNGSSDLAFDLAVLPKGKLLVAGTAFTPGASQDFAIARYRWDGRLDYRFGSRGRVTTDFFGDFDVGTAISVDAEDRIIVAGNAYSSVTGQDFAVARYDRWGSLDERFGEGGRVTLDLFGGADGAEALALQQDGKIVVAGVVVEPNMDPGDFALVRFHSKPSKYEGMRIDACLDERVKTDTSLSRWVKEISGDSRYQDRAGGYCGARGYYYVAENTGQLQVEIDVSRAGRYRLRFRYRVGSPSQPDESVRVLVGGRSFDFHDPDLVNSDRWELSVPLEVWLGSGQQTIEFLSIGGDSVHLDQLLLEKK